jgi:hypothetical protein
MTEQHTEEQSAPLPDAPAEQQDAQEQLPDTVSRADFDELQSSHEKTQQQLSTMSGRLAAAETTAETNDRLFDRLDTLQTTLMDMTAAQAKAFADDTLDTLSAEIGSIRDKSNAESNQSRSTRTITSLRENLDAAVLGDDGNAVLDLATAPELQDARTKHNESLELLKNGRTEQAESMMARAVASATNATATAERAALRKQLADQEKGFATKSEELLEEAGVGDLSVNGGGGGGGGPITMDNIDALMADIASQPAARQKELRDSYRNVMRTGRLA